MSKSINILDVDYLQWVKELRSRYRQSQIKAAVKVNTEQIKYNWMLGRDIVEMSVEERWGEGVIMQLSTDLKKEMPDVTGLSKSNIYYCKKFYLLYNSHNTFFQQAVGKSMDAENPFQTEKSKEVERIFQQAAEIFEIPWGHHCIIMDRVKGDTRKAFFFVRQTIENGWSRSMLMNFIDTDLYERQGKALTNFKQTLPEETSELACEITKDPYNFAFTGITGKYNERKLKDALLANISHFLIELGTGFAYVGKEYRLQIGNREKFIDLLFYNLTLSCYVVIEVKIGELDFADVGQLGGYVVACNHLLRKEGRDNPTIGLLVCKQKNNLIAQYALESSSQPLGISEYELAKLYPEKVEGTIPTIEEIEAKLGEKDNVE